MNSVIHSVDCLGILKLRNVDLDQVSDSESRRRKQAPSVRVVFRAILRSENGTKILQTVSTPICCSKFTKDVYVRHFGNPSYSATPQFCIQTTFDLSLHCAHEETFFVITGLASVRPWCSSLSCSGFAAPSPGMPEIQRISHPECPVTGGEMIVVGRNFVKDESKLYVVEYEDGKGQLCL